MLKEFADHFLLTILLGAPLGLFLLLFPKPLSVLAIVIPALLLLLSWFEVLPDFSPLLNSLGIIAFTGGVISFSLKSVFICK